MKGIFACWYFCSVVREASAERELGHSLEVSFSRMVVWCVVGRLMWAK